MMKSPQLNRLSTVRANNWARLLTSWEMIWKLCAGRLRDSRMRRSSSKRRWRQRFKQLVITRKQKLKWGRTSLSSRMSRRKSKRIWRRRKLSFTVKNSKLKTCRRPNKSSPIAPRKWKLLWSQRNSRSNHWSNNFSIWRKSMSFRRKRTQISIKSKSAESSNSKTLRLS